VLCAVLVLALAVAIALGKVPVPFGKPAAAASHSASTAGSASAGTTASASPSPTGPVDPLAGLESKLKDPLKSGNQWPADKVDAVNKARCRITPQGLVATHGATGSYRCGKTPPDVNAYDMAVLVDMELLDVGTCAAIWLRFTGEAGYLVRFCPDGIYTAVHGAPTSSTIAAICDPVPVSFPVNEKVRIGVVVRGYDFTFLRDGQPIGRGGCADRGQTFTSGHPVLGIYTKALTDPALPNGVRLTNVEIWVSPS
jgi:hypothetical protein